MWKAMFDKFLQRTCTVTRKSIMIFPTCLSTSVSSSISSQLQELCDVISRGVGGLDELEKDLNQYKIPLTPSAVVQVINSCKEEAPSRRLLRFFSWSCGTLNCRMEDRDFNHVIRVLTEKNDFIAIDMLISDLGKQDRMMERQTFSIVAETLVKIGKEDQALGIFKNLQRFKCPHDSVTVVAMINALCCKGHARKAEGVLENHRDKLSDCEACVYRNLLYGWAAKKYTKHARRILQMMEANNVMPDLFCYNMFLKCVCSRNIKFNPSGLVQHALDTMLEMRSKGIAPNALSYNILLSCLGRARRVKDSCRVLCSMKEDGCCPNWVSYYLVVRVLFLTGRFGKGKKVVEEMIAEGLVPEPRFYYDLVGILCGVERVNHGIWLFELMKKNISCEYGPVYDLLIKKLCKGGDFQKGRELWDDAVQLRAALRCSREVLDPSVTEVFKFAGKKRNQLEELKEEK